MPPRKRPAVGAARRGAAQKPDSQTATRAIAALGPHRPGASATRCADWAERSNGPCGCLAVWLFGCSAAHPHLAAPAAGRLRGEHARRRAHASSTDSPWLSERSAPARSEFHGAPRNRPDAGLPRSNAKGSQTVGRLSFGYFSLAKQRTSTSPAGARPGLRPQKKHTINYKNNSFQRLPHKRKTPKTLNISIARNTSSAPPRAPGAACEYPAPAAAESAAARSPPSPAHHPGPCGAPARSR